jgi:hypothetical protein
MTELRIRQDESQLRWESSGIIQIRGWTFWKVRHDDILAAGGPDHLEFRTSHNFDNRYQGFITLPSFWC